MKVAVCPCTDRCVWPSPALPTHPGAAPLIVCMPCSCAGAVDRACRRCRYMSCTPRTHTHMGIIRTRARHASLTHAGLPCVAQLPAATLQHRSWHAGARVPMPTACGRSPACHADEWAVTRVRGALGGGGCTSMSESSCMTSSSSLLNFPTREESFTASDRISFSSSSVRFPAACMQLCVTCAVTQRGQRGTSGWRTGTEHAFPPPRAGSLCRKPAACGHAARAQSPPCQRTQAAGHSAQGRLEWLRRVAGCGPRMPAALPCVTWPRRRPPGPRRP